MRFKTLSEYDDEIKKIDKINVGLHLDTNDHCIYIYSYSFDFNNFTPIPIKEIYEIKQEIAILLKYGVDTSALEAKINSYGLPEDIVRRL